MSPEALLQGWLGGSLAELAAETISVPLMVPYDHLADIDGWLLTIGNEPAPIGATSLPGSLSAGSMSVETRVAGAMLIAADYSVRRGASDAVSARTVLVRESPVAFVASSGSERLRPLLDAAERAGIPVAFDRLVDAEAVAREIAPFGRRRSAHREQIGRRHDPALSFPPVALDAGIGGNSRSSFVLHNEGERDGVTVTGELGPRVGIEIGLGGGVGIEETLELEALAATMPSFLRGVTSVVTGPSVRIGWRRGAAPTAEQIGGVMRAWLKAFTGAPIAEVRIGFAPAMGRSSLLTDMRARASAFRQYRAAVIAGDRGPLAAVTGHTQSEEA
jgi:hypothetical protein